MAPSANTPTPGPNLRALNDHMSVAPQIFPDEMQAIADAGYRIIICNRPDDEEPGQPSMDQVEEAARAAGLEFYRIPIISGQFTAEAAHETAKVIERGEKTLAYCRSGARCSGLWALARLGDLEIEEIGASIAGAGYDFRNFEPLLRARLQDMSR